MSAATGVGVAVDGPPGVPCSSGGGRTSPRRSLPAPLPRSFHARPAPEVARALLGAVVVRIVEEGPLVGTIVETEAYLGPEDLASHARSGRTGRNGAMFGPPGHAYVYRVYGLHSCLNVVTGMDGEAEAVLIRAVVPEHGEEAVRRRRGRPTDPVARLLAGPACVCQGLGIDRADDGLDLTVGDRLWIGAPAAAGTDLRAFVPDELVATGPRVGVGYAAEPWASLPFRFGIAGHVSLSRPFGPQLGRRRAGAGRAQAADAPRVRDGADGVA